MSSEFPCLCFWRFIRAGAECPLPAVPIIRLLLPGVPRSAEKMKQNPIGKDLEGNNPYATKTIYTRTLFMMEENWESCCWVLKRGRREASSGHLITSRVVNTKDRFLQGLRPPASEVRG